MDGFPWVSRGNPTPPPLPPPPPRTPISWSTLRHTSGRHCGGCGWCRWTEGPSCRRAVVATLGMSRPDFPFKHPANHLHWSTCPRRDDGRSAGWGEGGWFIEPGVCWSGASSSMGSRVAPTLVVWQSGCIKQISSRQVPQATPLAPLLASGASAAHADGTSGGESESKHRGGVSFTSTQHLLSGNHERQAKGHQGTLKGQILRMRSLNPELSHERRIVLCVYIYIYSEQQSGGTRKPIMAHPFPEKSSNVCCLCPLVVGYAS